MTYRRVWEVYGILWVEASDAAKNTTLDKIEPHNKMESVHSNQ